MNRYILILVSCVIFTLNISCRKGETVESVQVTDTENVNNALPTQGLVAYFSFNGNTNDASGNGYNGVNHGATLTSDRFGRWNCAYKFNGADNYIDYGIILDSVFSADTAKFSVSVWTCPQMEPGNSSFEYFLMGKAADLRSPFQWAIYQNFHWFLGYAFSEGLNDQANHVLMSENRWYHLVLIFDGTKDGEDKLHLYSNDTLNDPVMYSDGQLSTTTRKGNFHLYVGGTASGFSYIGIIDDIRIYNRALTVPEIDSLYHEGGWLGY